MNLAKATEALSKKDSEKTEVQDAIEELKELSAQGVKAKVQFSVFQIDGHGSLGENDVFIQYDISPAASIVTEDSITKKALKDVVKGNLKSKDVCISMQVKFVADGTCYSAETNLKHIPEDKEYRDELTSKPVDSGSKENSAKITVHFKILYDKIDSLLDSKKIELEQVEKEFKALGDQVKEARKKPAKKKEQAKSPKKKSAKKENSEASEQSAEISIVSSVVDFAMAAPTMALTHRGFLFFGLAAVGIFFFGEEVSV